MHPLCLGFKILLARFLLQPGALSPTAEAEGPAPDGGEGNNEASVVSRFYSSNGFCNNRVP